MQINNKKDQEYSLILKLIDKDNIKNKQNNREFEYIFKSVWNNRYINSIIFKHIQLYRRYYKWLIYDSKELFYSDFKSYINILTINNIYKDYPIQYGIKKLIIKGGGSQLDESSIPNSVTSLSFKRHLNEPIKQNCIPNSIKILEVNRGYKNLIKNITLPSSLETLIIGDDFNILGQNEISSTVNSLQIGERIERINNRIPKTAKPSVPLNSNLSGRYIEANAIPNSVLSLTFGDFYNTQINANVIPSSVTSIIFGLAFNQQILPNVIGQNVTTLKFDYSFNQPIIPHSLPPSIKVIIFGFNFNRPLEIGSLPPFLNILKFSTMFNQSIDNILPDTITELRLGYYFNHPINKSNIPKNLKRLVYASRYIENLEILKSKEFSNIDIKIIG